MKRDIEELVKGMSLEEKASLCSGEGFWHTKPVERLGVPSIMMTDGPIGLRKKREGASEGGIGVDASVPATCFPSGVALASSWDRALLERVGAAIAEEALVQGVSILLGPAVNIKRSPLCGRNFEYLSEDPYLVGELAARYISGVQSRGVGTSLKHFAANNQEKNRLLVDAVVDEKTLREIYLRGFETAVKKGRPWTVMCAYNKLNGLYCSENPWLLSKVLKDEWGHEGVLVTDWGACNDRVAGLLAGQDLQMPGDGGVTDAEIAAAVRSGVVPMDALDQAVRRILRIVFMAVDGAKNRPMPDVDSHHAIARSAAAECIVLLKNDGDILPLSKKGKIAIIGEMARAPRYQGGGSSHVNPSRLDNAYQEAVRLAGNDAEVRFAAGYPTSGDAADPALLEEARGLASWADVAVVFIGLPEEKESEGFDRPGLEIPASHSALVKAVCGVQRSTVVVLSNGGPIGMPWIARPRAVLEGYLGGQAGGGAIADVLFGEVNPSGKLAETFPVRLEDTPAYLNFPGENRRVEYREGIFVGYRHYDAIGIEPLFPFGHGLSYTRFEYSDLELDKTECLDTEGLAVSVKVKNLGRIPGKEVVQLYVGTPADGVIRPPKELAGFEKIHLEAGEQKTVRFRLDARSFAFWDRELPGWRVESGIHRILVCSSSRDIRLQAEVSVKSMTPRSVVYDRNTSIGELRDHPLGAGFVKAGEKSFLAQFGALDPDSPEARMMKAMADELPIRNLVQMGDKGVSRELLNDMIAALNGKPQSDRLKKFLR